MSPRTRPAAAAAAETNALAAQRILASVFLVLGAPCLVVPRQMLSLCVRPEALAGSDAEPLMMGCFGSQAVLQGCLLLVCRFRAETFLCYGLAIAPFYAFNWYFSSLGPRPLLTDLMLVDFFGNSAMIFACWYGYRQLKAVEDGRDKAA